jgi:anti-sigma factor RsiW
MGWTERSRMAEHNCHELLRYLSDYVDGEIDPQICEQIEHHVAGCTDCRTVIETLEGTIALYHALPEKRLTPGASDRLCHALGLDSR